MQRSTQRWSIRCRHQGSPDQTLPAASSVPGRMKCSPCFSCDFSFPSDTLTSSLKRPQAGPAVHEWSLSGDESCAVAGKKRDGCGDFPGLCKTSHGDVGEIPLIAFASRWVVGAE